MAIEPDLRSLKRFWSLEAGHLEFVVKADFGSAAPDLEELLEIATGIHHRLRAAGNNHAEAEGWVLTKSGWAGVLVNAYTIDDGLEWFELFTATWGDAIEGSIIGGPPSRLPSGRDPDPQLTAYVAYTTGDLAAVPSEDRSPLWYVEGKVTRHVMEQATSWAYTRGCRQYLTRAADWVVEVVGPNVGRAMAQGIERYGQVAFKCAQEAPFRERFASFWAQGRGVYQVVDATLGWQERLALVDRVLSWTPPHTDLAMVRYGLGGVGLWNSPTVPWPYVREPDVRYNRPLLASFVPDVSGIQLLTDAHLERAHDLSGWDIESLAGGRNLVRARDLAAWYAQPVPDPDLLAQARADFGAMILTPDLIPAYSPWDGR